MLETITDIVSGIIVFWPTVVTVVAGLMSVLVAIAKATPNKTDDEIATKGQAIWNKIQVFVDKYLPFIASKMSDAKKAEDAEKVVNA